MGASGMGSLGSRILYIHSYNSQFLVCTLAADRSKQGLLALWAVSIGMQLPSSAGRSGSIAVDCRRPAACRVSGHVGRQLLERAERLWHG